MKFNEDVFQFYKKLIEIRRKQSALTLGDLDFILVDDQAQTLAYSRLYKGEEVIVAFNTSNQIREVELSTKTTFNYFNLITLKPVKKSEEGKLVLQLEPNSAVILSRIVY